MKEKEKALELLKQKINGEINITYQDISDKTKYSIRWLITLSKQIEKKDIETLLVHGLTGKASNNSVPDQEIEFIKNFKNQYPSISISQFQDIYNEDVIFNPKMKKIVEEYSLKQRSLSFFQQLYKKEGWKSPIKHKSFSYKKDNHTLRDPMPRTGMLILTDGTPYDWFENGEKHSLHMTLDDATGEIISGWFMKNECMFGYCMSFKLMLLKKGIPLSIYSDRTLILYSPSDNKTQVGRMLDELGIEIIYANSSEAKGKIERMNETIQNRLVNDIKRARMKGIKLDTYSDLNKWFNTYYIKYINKKFAYKPKEEETEFVKLTHKTNLTHIFCLKDTRLIQNGNIFSYNNNYYVPIKPNGDDYIFYKGTQIEVWEDVFSHVVRVYKNNKIYNTRQIEGHFQDPIKQEQKRINNQKELEQAFENIDKILKERQQ